MDITISKLLSESISDFGKGSNWKYCNYANWRIFSLTTSRSPKLIPKADFKWICPYFNSKIFFGVFWSSQKIQKWISHCLLKSCMANGRGQFWRYHMGYLEFLVHFYLRNHARLVKFSYLNLATLNLYPIRDIRLRPELCCPPY